MYNFLEKLYDLPNCESFINYYKVNWSNCKHMWVPAYLNNKTTYGERTNNRVEQNHKTLKDFVHHRMTIANCLRGVLDFLKYRKNEYNFKAFRQK